MSYAFKYALLKTFCLETGEQDPEMQADSKYEPEKVNVAVSDDKETTIKNIKNALWQGVDKDHLIQDYLQELSKALELSLDETILECKDVNKFVREFNSWKKKKEKAAPNTKAAA